MKGKSEMKTICAIEINEMVERFIKSMIELSEDPSQVFVGIHNSFYHGDILDKIRLHFTDEQLGKIYEGIELSQSVLDQIKEQNE